MTQPQWRLDPDSPEGKAALEGLAQVLDSVDARLAREDAEQQIRSTA